MYAQMNEQLAADRLVQLRADAHRARHRRARRAERAADAGQALARREWRLLLQALVAR